MEELKMKSINRRTIIILILILLVIAIYMIMNPPHPIQIEKLSENIRAPVDTIGFAHKQNQIEAVVSCAENLERESLQQEAENFEDPWIAGISPHDDYVYAGRVYVHLMRNIRAKRIVLFGVAHKAADWNVENKLIFDDFDYWKSPYGKVVVSSLRKEILLGLPEDQRIVSNKFHSVEHSLEALIPFLHYYIRDVEIIPILVPYMKWERMDTLSSSLARVLSEIIKKKNLVVGKDIAFVISSDCVHYGDEGWGGKNFAHFGTDKAGYKKAVAREHRLIKDYLTGPIKPTRLRSFLYTLVDENNVHDYKITWCGRFSIPFGLNCVYRLMKYLDHPPLEGHLLRYGTSLDRPYLPVENLGLGTTAPATLHHWVGYCAVGYF